MSVFKASRNKIMAAFALLLATAAGTAGIAAAGGPKPPLRCEILVTPKNGMVTLQGMVLADSAIDGTYSLQVEGSGKSGGNSIQQGGAFSATAGRKTALGLVSLGAKGAEYTVTLDLQAGGKTASCSQWVGGRI